MSAAEKWFAELADCTRLVEVTGAPQEHAGDLGRAIQVANRWITAASAARGKLIFIGNGGSAGICSHMAIDFLKNGNVPAMALNDSSALTCLGNDLGYDQVFARQVEAHCTEKDILIAISSSGMSPNILTATLCALQDKGASAITFTGFKPDNHLRQVGDLNFYVPSDNYGFVETAHQAILHAILDIRMGWKPK